MRDGAGVVDVGGRVDSRFNDDVAKYMYLQTDQTLPATRVLGVACIISGSSSGLRILVELLLAAMFPDGCGLFAGPFRLRTPAGG